MLIDHGACWLQVMHSSKVYGRLGERLGLTDHPSVLNVMLAKVAKNLQVGLHVDCFLRHLYVLCFMGSSQ